MAEGCLQSRPALQHEPPLPNDLELLSELGKAEAETIRRLERSNGELLAALLVEEDADARAMVEQNRAVLQRKYARLAAISAKVQHWLLLRSRDCSESLQGDGSSCGSAAPAGGAQAGLTGVWESSTDMAGDETAAAAAALLQRVKRRGSELEEDSVSGDLRALAIGPPPRKVAATATSFAATRATDGTDSDGWEASSASRPGRRTESPEAGPATSGSEDAVPSAVERMGALLRRVKRKAAELEADTVANGICSLSLTTESSPSDAEAHRGSRTWALRPKLAIADCRSAPRLSRRPRGR